MRYDAKPNERYEFIETEPNKGIKEATKAAKNHVCVFVWIGRAQLFAYLNTIFTFAFAD